MRSNKLGKRSRKRIAMNKRLKAKAEAEGITSCELRLDGCLKTWALSWAHSRKARFLTDDEKWMHACLACASCHQKIEAMSHEEMFRLVSEALERR